MQYRLIVAGLIIKEDKILLGQKAPGKGPYPDTWHIPGGGVDLDSESCEEAIKREIHEEAGIQVTNLEQVAWDTDIELNKHGEETYYVFLQYSCEYKSGELLPGDDMHHFEWVEIKKLKDYNLNKPTLVLLEKLGYLGV